MAAHEPVPAGTRDDLTRQFTALARLADRSARLIDMSGGDKADILLDITSMRAQLDRIERSLK